MQAPVAYKGGPWAVEEALESLKDLAFRARELAGTARRRVKA